MTSASGHEEEHKCSNCFNSASFTCKACKALPNDTDGKVVSTWYCGLECQKAHWTAHKAQCKAARARQALYRAGATAQEIFYLFQKVAFMWNPTKIERKGTYWLLYPEEGNGTIQLRPFPYELVPEVRDQHALLSSQGCTAAMSDMHFILKALLKGLYIGIEEISHKVKGEKLVMRWLYPTVGGPPEIDSTVYEHSVLRVTMKDGQTYALDLAGAQYGWQESVMTWERYSASRIQKKTSSVPFGETRVSYGTVATSTGGNHEWMHRVSQAFAKTVEEALVSWRTANISLVDLVRLPAEPEFQEKQSSLLETVDKLLQRYRTLQESQGGFEVKGGFKPSNVHYIGPEYDSELDGVLRKLQEFGPKKLQELGLDDNMCKRLQELALNDETYKKA